MATLTPTLTLSSPAGDVTSDEINFTVTDSLTVSSTGKKIISNGRIATSNSASTFLAASDYGKSYVYLRNVDSSIEITITSGSQAFMTLAAEEFAFFPWDGSGDLKETSASGTPVLEYAVFEA